MSFRTFDPMLWPPGAQTAYAKGAEGTVAKSGRTR